MYLMRGKDPYSMHYIKCAACTGEHGDIAFMSEGITGEYISWLSKIKTCPSAFRGMVNAHGLLSECDQAKGEI